MKINALADSRVDFDLPPELIAEDGKTRFLRFWNKEVQVSKGFNHQDMNDYLHFNAHLFSPGFENIDVEFFDRMCIFNTALYFNPSSLRRERPTKYSKTLLNNSENHEFISFEGMMLPSPEFLRDLTNSPMSCSQIENMIALPSRIQLLNSNETKRAINPHVLFSLVSFYNLKTINLLDPRHLAHVYRSFDTIIDGRNLDLSNVKFQPYTVFTALAIKNSSYYDRMYVEKINLENKKGKK